MKSSVGGRLWQCSDGFMTPPWPRLETGPLCFSAFSRDQTRMNAHGCSAGYMKQRGFLFCDERKNNLGGKTLPRPEVEFVFVSVKLLPALSYTSMDLDCCRNVSKAFQVLLNLPRSLPRDEGVANIAFPTLDHIQHSLLLNNLNLRKQIFLLLFFFKLHLEVVSHLSHHSCKWICRNLF